MKNTRLLLSVAGVLAALAVGYLSIGVDAQAPVAKPAVPAPGSEWKTYGGDLASTRYSPLDQINKDNFSKLQVAWRLKTDFLGPRPDTLFSATPLVIGNVLYTTAGSRRAVVALNASTGEMLWMHAEDEGQRGMNAPRNGSGRGVSYWSSADGTDQRIIYVTPGYRMIALNAKTGALVPTFGKGGVVDLKLDIDQSIDLLTAEIGLNATPLVAGDVVVVGAAHRAAGNPRSAPTARGYVRGFDVRTGKRIWVFHTIPLKGEFGYDTWENGSAEKNGNLGMWAQASADLELGLVYLPLEMPASDYYGVNRPGNTLYSESLVAVDIKTGKRKWHYQTVHHGLWDWDLPCAPILFDMMVDGKRVKALAQPTKQAFLFVLNRETGVPIWPIEERPVPQSTVPGEKTSPTQPFPTKPKPFDQQGVSVDDLIDFTPALRAEAAEFVKRYRLGPLFTPPALATPDGPLSTLMMPADVGGANWPGGSLDPETNRLYIHSHTSLYQLANVPAELAQAGPDNVAGQLRAGGAPAPGRGAPGGPGAAGPAGPAGGGRGAAVGGRGAAAIGARGAGAAGAPGGARGGGRGGLAVQGLPLMKPPYDRITAYDMNTGDMLWQKPHSATSDAIRNNPALKGADLKGLDINRLGAVGRIFIGTLVTKTLVIAGDGGVHTNAAGERVALLRAYDKATGADLGQVNMPGQQTGSPMTYMIDGKQFLVVAASSGPGGGAELIAYALP